MKLFLRPAVVGLRPARAQVGPVNGRNHSPIEYSLQTVVRVPLFAIFSQPTLPRFLQFPHSSRHLLLPFGTRQGKVRSFGPLSALSSPPSTVPSLPTGLLYHNHTFLLPAVRVTLLPPSSSSFRQLQLFQWIDHNVFVTSYSPATRTIHSAGQRPRRPARQRHAVLPPSTMGASSACTLNSPPRLPSLQPWFISGGMTLPSYF